MRTRKDSAPVARIPMAARRQPSNSQKLITNLFHGEKGRFSLSRSLSLSLLATVKRRQRKKELFQKSSHNGIKTRESCSKVHRDKRLPIHPSRTILIYHEPFGLYILCTLSLGCILVSEKVISSSKKLKKEKEKKMNRVSIKCNSYHTIVTD